MMQQRGILSEKDVSMFIDALSVDVGVKITQVSSKNLEDGIYLGDILVAVNDTHVFNQFHIADLMNAYPNAKLTFTRGNHTFTTDMIIDWKASGSFYTKSR
jgi:hypothetical protein